MNDQATVAALPPWLRLPLLVAGTLLVLTAIRMLLRRDTGAAPGADQRAGLLGRAVAVASALAAHLPGLRRASDGTALPVLLARAPHSRPSRWVAAGVRAEAIAAANGNPALPRLERSAAGVRLLAGAIAGLPAAVVTLIAFGSVPAVIAASLATAVGCRMPDAVLAVAARGALRSARHDVAATVDLLAAAASAGLSLPEAMVLTAGHAPPPLAAVLRAAALRRAMGDDPREALTTEARRYGLPLLADVAQAMERQRRLGVPLGPELSRIAAQIRTEQRAAALRRASRRGPLGTLVVALVIAPTCLAAVVACLVGGLLQGGALPLR